jgi:hypothetical protein
MARKQSEPPDESRILREIATRKIEAERTRAEQLEAENAKLRTMAADLQKKISLSSSRVTELERKLKSSLSEVEKNHKAEQRAERDALKAEIKDLKEQQKIEAQRERDRWEKRLNEMEIRHQREVDRLQQKGEREVEKIAGTAETVEQRLADLQDALTQERQAHQQAQERLRKLEQTSKRIGVRSGQITGYEVETPEELLEVIGEVDADAPLKALRAAMRQLRSAASNIERAFTKALRSDDARAELHEAGEHFSAARDLPDTEELPPASAMLVEEAFTVLSEETAERVKGRHYSALIGAIATEMVRVLRNQREDMSKLQRLVEIAEGTELATPARLLLKGATGHQQELAAARLLADELKQVQAEAREQKGKVKKLYAVAEQGIAGEWAVNALQAMASLQSLPRPDREAAKRPLFNRVIESAKLVQERIDSAMNLGAEAEAGLRESDDSFSGLEGLVQNMHEVLVAARREIMSKVEGEEDARLKLEAGREALLDIGKRGKRAVAIFDESLKSLDMLLNQWKATYKTYSALSRDVDRIEASIDGAMLDINQPLESEDGKRLYQIIHDLSEHLPEYRGLATLKQRLFFHLENPKQRVWEIQQVLESSDRICRAVGEPENYDYERNYQSCMARMYRAWGQLEEARGGTHSQLAVTAERVEPVLSEVYVWLSSSNVNKLTDGQRDELMLTASYLRRLKRHILGIHDLEQQAGGRASTLTAQFEQSLDSVEFPAEWQHLLKRLKAGRGPTGNGGEVYASEDPVDPPTEREA